MNEAASSLFETTLGLLGVAGGIAVALAAIAQMWLNRRQRQLEHRWKQANVLRELLTEIHQHKLASNAVTMLDWHGGSHAYKRPDGDGSVFIDWNDVIVAAAMDQRSCPEPARWIRDCLDWLYYYIDRIAFYATADLVDRADVEAVFRKYARIVNRQPELYSLLERLDYGFAVDLFDSIRQRDTVSKGIECFPEPSPPSTRR